MPTEGGPRCPNHNCPLVLTEKEKAELAGESPCMLSGAMFKWTQRLKRGGEVMVKDKDGNLTSELAYHVEGKDSTKEG